MKRMLVIATLAFAVSACGRDKIDDDPTSSPVSETSSGTAAGVATVQGDPISAEASPDTGGETGDRGSSGRRDRDSGVTAVFNERTEQR